MSIRRLLATAAVVLTAATGAGAAPATEVASWVDEQGVTHFGDAQFAPARANVVEIAPANGMQAPSRVNWGTAAGPRLVKISKPKKRNKRGWRGRDYTINRGWRSGR